MAARLLSIGERLRAYRISAGLSADELGERLNMSRASVYRLETNGIGRIDTLERVARLLDVSVETLLGVGVEYVPSALAYFERLRQIEAASDHAFVAFGPIVYLLTSDGYDTALRGALTEQVTGAPNARRTPKSVEDLMGILARRKAQYRQRPLSLTNLLSVPDLLRFADRGLAGVDTPPKPLQMHRDLARQELTRIADLLAAPPMGVQIGLVFDELPSTSFAILRQADASLVLTSPFRLGSLMNVWRGVAMISQAQEAVRLHTLWAQELWSQAVTGERAAEYVKRRILGTGGAA
jgi:transcriptional regulator with XRE-family HTH domain